jgi:hypothetical protein
MAEVVSRKTLARKIVKNVRTFVEGGIITEK